MSNVMVHSEQLSAPPASMAIPCESHAAVRVAPRNHVLKVRGAVIPLLMRVHSCVSVARRCHGNVLSRNGEPVISNVSTEAVDVLMGEDVGPCHPRGMTRSNASQQPAKVQRMTSVLRPHSVREVASPFAVVD